MPLLQTRFHCVEHLLRWLYEGRVGFNRPILRSFALSTPEVHRRHTGGTRDFPVYLW